MRCAVLQMCSNDNWVSNREKILSLLDGFDTGTVDLLLLPENFALFGHADVRAKAEQLHDEIIDFLAQIAVSHQLYLVAGSIPHPRLSDASLVADNKVRAACLVFDPDGRRVLRYDKIHMFDVNVDDSQGRYSESNTYQAGTEQSCIDIDNWRLGLSICYDLRFAEFYTNYAKMGVNLITVPSAFTAHTGQAHWHLLLRTRAVETQSYVLAANQWGQHNTQRRSYGHSLIVDPWGEVIAQLNYGEGIVAADLELTKLNKIRSNMPIQLQRKL